MVVGGIWSTPAYLVTKYTVSLLNEREWLVQSLEFGEMGHF